MFDSIINYIIKVLDPGVIIIFIAVLYIYVSSLNKMIELMVTKEDFESLQVEIVSLSKDVTELKASSDMINSQLSTSLTELNAQLNSLSETINELMSQVFKEK